MAERLGNDQTVSVEEVALSNSDEIAALDAVLGRKVIITLQEIIDEIMRMRSVKT